MSEHQYKAVENLKCSMCRTTGFYFKYYVDFYKWVISIIGDAIRPLDLYTDDTTLYDIGLDKDMLENNLQYALNLLKIWCVENGMIINIDKNKTDVYIKSAKGKHYIR